MQNIIGHTFGNMLVVGIGEDYVRPKSGKKSKRFLCLCKCGKVKQVAFYDLHAGKVISCGCSKMGNLKHGMERHPLYSVWKGIKKRCYNANELSYADYGARGISVCEEWLNSPKSFILWGLSNGWSKGLEIDRIDNNGNYSPSNCRFVTRIQNANNKRNNIIVNGKTLAQISLETNTPYQTVYDRYKNGRPLTS